MGLHTEDFFYISSASWNEQHGQQKQNLNFLNYKMLFMRKFQHWKETTGKKKKSCRTCFCQRQVNTWNLIFLLSAFGSPGRVCKGSKDRLIQLKIIFKTLTFWGLGVHPTPTNLNCSFLYLLRGKELIRPMQGIKPAFVKHLFIQAKRGYISQTHNAAQKRVGPCK